MAFVRLWLNRVAHQALNLPSTRSSLSRAAALLGPPAFVLALCAALGLISASVLLSLVVPATAGQVSEDAAAGITVGCLLAGVVLGTLVIRTAPRP